MQFVSQGDNSTNQAPVGTLSADIVVDMSITAPTVIYAFQESASHADRNATTDTWYPNGADVIISSTDTSIPKPTYTLKQ